MEQCRQVTLLGDSILKGIQVDLGSRRYRAQNAAACWIGCWTGAPPAIFW